ncbi:MAG: SusC/RagA family TonB-linked outer membrane protein [Clostridium sp.]|nr:SusC/RagA family TonB-linked outer membrane protein [Bacteroides sp.]MCM1197863.1 SusC/RagA family TonB-linked outer membrane protein [Clostridium sp.]
MKNIYPLSIIPAFLISCLCCAEAFSQEKEADDLRQATAVSEIDVDKVARYPDLSISNALQGQAAGLIVHSGTGGLGYNIPAIYIRGLHAGATSAIVIVDGIERDMNDLTAEEIGSIEILKDASAKILYGPRATNGVVLITTKRGIMGKRSINATIEYGITPTARTPKFLNAADYAILYNEARLNDGLAARYQPSQIEGYRNSSGENDLLYPDVDWYGKFTRNMGTYRKAVVEFIGGSDKVKYALVAGYTGGDGLEKVGQRSTLHRINVRGNLDIRITDFLTVAADVAARLEIKNWSGLNSTGLYGAISTYRPNEYPLVMDAAQIGKEEQEGGIPYYGASTLHTNNLLVDMEYGGSKSERYVNSQTNFGIRLDFNRYVKGLTANAFITFDNYNYVQQGITRTYATYAVDSFLDADGLDRFRVTQMTKINQSDDIHVNDESTTRRLGANGDISYRRSIGRNDFSAEAAFRYYKDEVEGANQNCMTANGTLRLNYGYNRRLFAEAILGVAGSNQFSENRWLFTYTGSLGYVISTSPYVKIKAGGGRLGYNPNSNYMLYRTAWVNSGSVYLLGNNNNTSAHITNLARIGNPYLEWVTSSEANLGVEGSFFTDRLYVEVNGFYEQRNRTITSLSSKYSAIAGNYLPSFNYGSVANRGFEIDVKWNDTVSGGDFRYGIGANFTYTRNKVLKTDEVDMEDYRKSAGRPTSAIMGLQSEGLFGKDVSLEGHARQMYGYYTEGDIAYRDMNNDGIIDDKDQTMFGQSFPVGTLGVNIDLKYKGFGLYVLGTAELGASVMLNNSYYWNTGSNSYSVYALRRYHPENNPEGTLPRLTSTSGSNSYRNSDFWIADASWFRLKNVELSYTWTNRKTDGVCKSFRFFVRGTNLCVASGIKDLDPEVINAGISNYPIYRTVTGGVTIGF